QQTEESLAALQEVTGEDSAMRFELTNTLQELSRAARSIRNLTDYLERHPESLFKGKQGY
ncbi:MAG: mammalian cell entry protein, partial [Desulfohalobiaceae bacterium]|nr:mammalian cell entry protein [Desulfohalobiaceae bacterium]